MVIVADDLGYGDLGVYGQQRILTPNIDRLAAEGMRFTQAYAPAPVCAPTRCSLMTGFHSGHCAVDRNANPNLPLRVEDVTIGQILGASGYSTAWVGKWALGGAETDGTPINVDSAPWNKGFVDLSFGYVDQVAAHDHYPEFLWRAKSSKPKIVPIPGNAGGAEGVYAHDLLIAEARSFIRSHSSDLEPFFLYLPFTLPHADILSPPGPNPYDDQPWPSVERAFAAMVTRLDSDVGEIADLLDDLGLAESTLLLVTSDNGPQQAEGHKAEFFDSNGPLRGIKRDLYEGGIRVPLIARWPGRVAAGSVSDLVVSLTDLLPTAAELSGTPAPRGIDGVSFAPTLLGAAGQAERSHLFWAYPQNGSGVEPVQRVAVREGDLKYLRRADGIENLFDLSVDPGETNDLSASRPVVVGRLREIATAEATGPPHVRRAVLGLRGGAEGGGRRYVLDFGAVDAGADPVTLSFRVKNTAPGYAHVMTSVVDTSSLSDDRLSLRSADLGFLVSGALSAPLRVTLDPIRSGALVGQQLVFVAKQKADGKPAVNSPVVLEIRGNVVPVTLFEDGFESGSTSKWSSAVP